MASRRPQRGNERSRRVVIAAVLIAAVLIAAGLAVAILRGGGTRPAQPRAMESILQDDQFLIYDSTSAVGNTLDALSALGVDRVRVTVLWQAIAPDSASSHRPRHFDASDPAAYPARAWQPYDRLVALAAARGIAVDFNLTAPGPLWAMVTPAPSTRVANHYRPSPGDFGRFVQAVGRRYSGGYRPAGGQGPALPRVSFWTVWNEPNQPGWLAPQWRSLSGQRVPDSPRLYRLYADAGFRGLALSGHSPAHDTILIGELAPEGSQATAEESPISPMRFLRALYCVDDAYRPLRGFQARALHCPASGSPAGFAQAHPALFQATGFAHHPYAFFLAPGVSMSNRDFVPLADLARLESGLDRVFALYGVHRHLPLWITEYGYETNPPNPFRGVSPDRQALYLDEAQYLAWKDPRVRSMAQFLLTDSAPDSHYPRGSLRYWSTFQTGLFYLGARPKPALAAYRLPIFIPQERFAPGGGVLVWGMLRAAPNGRADRVELQWRGPAGRYQPLASVSTSDPDGFFTVQVRPPGSGTVRLAWRGLNGIRFYSRAAAVMQR